MGGNSLLGSAEHQGRYADLGSECGGMLSREVAADCVVLGTDDLDAGSLHSAGSASEMLLASRRLPLWIRRVCLRLGHGIENWLRSRRPI
jgi:hypothetical protein